MSPALNKSVIPAKAGIQLKIIHIFILLLDTGFRRCDEKDLFRAFLAASMEVGATS